MENEPFLIANRAQTPDGTILWSRYVHDSIFYEDANGDQYMNDGGTEYQHRTVNKVPMKDLSVWSNASFEEIRKVMLRGTFAKDGERIWVPLYKMNNLHLIGILDYNENLGIHSKFDQFIKKEIEYRKNHNINIEDGPYDHNIGVEAITKHDI